MHAGDEALDHQPRAHVEVREPRDHGGVEQLPARGARAGQPEVGAGAGAGAGEGGAHALLLLRQTKYTGKPSAAMITPAAARQPLADRSLAMMATVTRMKTMGVNG